jgi:mono/diheme cytochrome c family protein
MEPKMSLRILKRDVLRSFVAFSVFIFIVGISSCTTKSEDSTSQESSSASSSDTSNSMGVGPITSPVKIEAKINSSLAAQGKKLFEARCTACHKFETKYVGPALNGVTKRRRPEWIMNMILNPSEMTQKDETAKALLAEHLTQMANQNLTKDEARAVYEYFRLNDEK